MRYQAKPFDETALDAVERSKHGRWHGLIIRLCCTIREAWQELAVLREEKTRRERDEAERREREEAAYTSRERVLVVVRPDGFIQVYAEDWVSVCVVHCPNVGEAHAAKYEEKFLGAFLPKAYSEPLYWPGKLKEVGHYQWCLTPHQIQDGLLKAELFEQLDKVFQR